MPVPGVFNNFNPLNAELYPICYLLALLAHHFFHVSRIMVKSLTLRLLMSYIYDIRSLSINKLLYRVSSKIYNKFANCFCELKFSGNTQKDPSSAWGCDTSGNIYPCWVALRRSCRCTESHRVKNANQLHTFCTVVM
jgi:hypothetical protein